jgi:cell division protein FtsZ
MNQSGVAVMGCGIASGENRAIEAAQKAISSPLLDGVSIQGAKKVLVNVTGSDNLTMMEIYDGNNIIHQTVGEEADIIFGYVKKEEMNDYVSYTVIATGFDKQNSSSSQKPEKKATQERVGLPKVSSGFNFEFNHQVDPYDLQEPTIFRVNAATKVPMAETVEKQQEAPLSGFSSFEKMKNYALEQNRKEEAKVIPQTKNSDEDDSSAFLRMMMD